MLEPVAQKEDGWKDFLQKYDIYDNKLNEDQLYLRYEKLKEITFPLVNQDDWHLFFKDLLLLESGLVFGDSIGRSDVLPFNFEVTSDTPIRSKPIPYPAEERKWIHEYCMKQVELGVMRQIIRGKDQDPTFTCNVVLVKDGQSQQKYRFCGNFIPANQRIILPAQPMSDCIAAVDGLEGCTCYSAIDAKAGFQNVIVPEHLQKYLGIVTQDALLVYERMAWGTNAAAAHFQALMNYIMTNSKFPPRQVSFLDDCNVGGNDILATWIDTIKALALMILAGIPVNIKKCQFLVAKLQILGYLLSGGAMQLGDKAIKKLFGSSLPRTRRELQGLLGKLNFASMFIPEYRKKVQPLLDLLSKKSDGKWTKLHTDTLNQLGSQVLKRFKLGIVNCKEPATLYIDEDGNYVTAILTQGNTDAFRICGMATKDLTITEAKLARMERLLIAATWAYNRFGRYTYYLPQVCMSFPLEAEVCLVKCSQTMGPRLQARLIELSSYQCKFITSFSAWEILGSLEENYTTEEKPNEELGKIWKHIDIQIPPLSTPKEEQLNMNKNSWILQFDGGFAKKLGTGAHVLWDQGKILIEGKFYFYGSECSTNNHAELLSLVHALQSLRDLPIPEQIENIYIQGDSNLVISYMTGQATANASHLVQLYSEAKQLVRQIKHVKLIFQHVDRCNNTWADYLGRVALNIKGDGTLKDRTITMQSDIPSKPSFLNAHFEHVESTDENCGRCKQMVPERSQQCGGCAQFFHYSCLQAKEFPMRRGPWHCRHCIRKFNWLHIKDVTLDEELLCFLSHAEISQDSARTQYILKTSKYIYMSDDEQLWCTSLPGYGPRRIPLMRERLGIMKEVQEQSNYARGQAIYELLRPYFFWSGMLADCLALAASNVANQQVRAKFKQPPYLFPPSKGSYPFSLWCCDTIVNLQPASPHGGNNVIIACDPFTKWCEVGILDVLDSHHTTKFFHEQIVCRYGTPFAVRTDRGIEYRGAFDKYLKRSGIQHRLISTMNPRANGQAERTVRSIKEGLAKQLLNCKDVNWWDALPDVVRALRIVAPRATKLSPYLLVFKQQPLLPISHTLNAETTVLEEICEMEEEQAIRYWKEVFSLVRSNLVRNDKAMIKEYMKNRDLADEDVRFVFEKGDQVLLKSKVPSKQKCRAVGPYLFIEYMPPSGVVARIQNSSGKIYKVSALNLLPVRSGDAARMLKFPPQPTLGDEDSSLSSLFSEDDDPLALPPGVHVVPTEQVFQPFVEEAYTRFSLTSSRKRRTQRK